jgi:hypothetical protein
MCKETEVKFLIRGQGTKNGKWEEKENIHGAVEFLLAKFALASIKRW